MVSSSLVVELKHINLLLPDDEDFSLEGLNLTDRQRKSLKNMDMSSQLNMIKILREQ